MTWCFTLSAINTWLSFLFSESSSVCDNLHLHHWWHSWGVSFFTQFSFNNEYFWQVSIFVFKQGRTFFEQVSILAGKLFAPSAARFFSPAFFASPLLQACTFFSLDRSCIFFFWPGPFHSKTHSQWYDIYYMRRYLEELLLALCFQLAGYIGGQFHPFIITKEA